MFLENFALFVQGNECQWSHGNLSEQFIETSISFLSGLDTMGQELFGEGVATIKLDPKNSSSHVSEIFIVSLMGSFFFIISNPLECVKLIESSDNQNDNQIPQDLRDKIRAMLVGQAAVLYANMYSFAENKAECHEIERLFLGVLHKIGIVENLESYIDNGRCSFSQLDMSQLIYFHYYLRQEFEKEHFKVKSIRDTWALVSNHFGTRITLNYNVKDNITVLAGYLSAIHAFITELFYSEPQTLIFGGAEKLTSLMMFNGQENYMAVANPLEVFNDAFISSLENLEPDVLMDITPPVKQYFADKTTSKYRNKLLRLELRTLFNIYRNS
ncbi:MAG: hypothetical protein ACTSP4_01995 [Candidatus Hodarchaeales archaeon]